jgi:hypothetical protein
MVPNEHDHLVLVPMAHVTQLCVCAPGHMLSTTPLQRRTSTPCVQQTEDLSIHAVLQSFVTHDASSSARWPTAHEQKAAER